MTKMIGTDAQPVWSVQRTIPANTEPGPGRIDPAQLPILSLQDSERPGGRFLRVPVPDGSHAHFKQPGRIRAVDEVLLAQLAELGPGASAHVAFSSKATILRLG